MNAANKKQSDTLPFDGIIFDMDGTLVATTEADYLAWKWLLAEYNDRFTFQEYLPLMGIRSEDVLHERLGLQGIALQEALARKMNYYREIVSRYGVRLVPHARSFLEQLQQYSLRIALATSARREKVNIVQEKTGLLRFFDTVISGEDVHLGKPAPEIFLRAAQQLGVSSEKCLVVEDAVHGIAAAREAHMKCVAITYTHPPHMLQQADLVISSYHNANILDWCAQLAYR